MNGLEEAGYDITDMAFNRSTAPGDENLLVRFFPKPCENKAKSEAEGRPIYEDKDYIEIRVPGEREVRYCQPANSIDIARFPEHYRRYKARMSQETAAGTPLSEWPGVTRAQVEEFKFLNVTTVEQLLSISDTNAQKFMGIRALQQKAKAYLESANGQAAANALLETQKQLAEQKAINERLMARLDALEAADEGDAAPAPRRRGRPAAQE